MIYEPGRPAKYLPHEGKGISPPNQPGEYRIRNKNGREMYRGETCDLSRRCREHTNDKTKLKRGESFEYKIADGRSTSRTRREHEKYKIKKKNPYRNNSRGGEGRRKL